jgi:type I restriction enzyme S subunit
VSAVSWGASFPAEWPRTRIKYVGRFAGGGTPDKGNAAFWNGDIPWVSPKDMKSATIDDTEDHITMEGLQNSAAKLVAPGAVLLVMRSGILRHTIPVAINRVPVALNQDMRAISPLPWVEARFLARLLEGHQQQLLNAWSKVGSTVESLESDLVGETEIAIPPLLQQRAIADYLDRETARLDALVVAKERVIGLLAEKRRARITRAVTRGLDPRAPLRDSGIPWLGEIPAHWTTLMLRYACAAIQTGGTPSAEHIDDTGTSGVDWFTPGDFQDNLELRQSVRKVAKAAIDAGEARLFPPGTVFVVGIGATLGKTGFISRPASANQQINALVPTRHTDSRFLAYLLTLLGDVMNISANSATLPILNQQRMGQITVTLPPLEEQRAIVRWIEEWGSRVDLVRRATESTIALLRERRAALIAAAVTGQVEVAGA